MSVDNPSVRLGDPLPSRTRRPGRPGARRPGSRRPVWQEPPSRIGRVAQGGVLTGVVLAVLIPLWVVLVTSLSSRETINDAGGLVLVPRELDFSAYVTIFSGGLVTQALWVSTVLTVVGTAVSLTVTVLAAYGLSRPNSVAHRGLLFYFLLTFLVYPGMVPSYLVVTGLGLKDSLWALILPTAVNVFNLVVVRAFFQNIPGELLDSARIDGAGEFRILWRIVLPLSRAVIAVVGLFYAVGYWNVWFNALLYIDDNAKFPIQRVLQSFILAGQSPTTSGTTVGVSMPPTLAIKMAVVVVTVAPIVLVYPFVQRHFVKGVIIGAVKG
jgi:putative aldouronate transport system permease protein